MLAQKSKTPAGAATDPIRDTDDQPRNTTSNPQNMKNSADQTASEEKVGTAKKLDQLKDLLPAEISDDPTTDTVIDAVGGLLDEVAKRRAEREKIKSKQPSNNNANDRPARRFLKKLLDGGPEESRDPSSENTD